MTVGQIVTWDGSDSDVPTGHAGKVVGHPESGKARVEFSSGTYKFNNNHLTSCGYSVDDHVTWEGSDSDVPAGAVGTVEGISKGSRSAGRVRVKFPGGTFGFQHDQLHKTDALAVRRPTVGDRVRLAEGRGLLGGCRGGSGSAGLAGQDARSGG